MHKSSIRFAEVGEPSLLIFSIPSEISRSGENGQAYAQPLLSREGGFLVALPVESLSLEALSAAQQADDQDLLGPSYVVTVGLCEEDEFGQIYSIDHEVQVLLVDLSDSALQAFREYDPVTDSLEELQAYDDHHPAALPLSASLVSLAKQWTEDLGQSRLNFYSAREELETQSVAPKTPGQPKKAAPKRLTNAALAEQVAALATQVQALTALQQMPRPRPETAAPSAAPAGGQRLGLGLGPYPQMPALGQGFAHLGRPKDAAVKAAASLLGPPPKTQKKPAVPALPEEVARDEPQDPFQQAADPMLAALSLQSTALTSLVAHLAGHSTDPLIDLQGGSISSSSSSTRGVARREKMQSDLALRQSNYWLAFLQQLSRRMNPSRPVPTSTDMAKDSDLSFLAYLERHGAYKQSKEIGTILWVLGYIVDAAIAQDFDGVREHLALFATALDQAALDQGWSTAFLVTLAEEPPATLFAEKGTSLSVSKPFSPLMPVAWGAVLLAYLKDLDIMNSKKQESPSKKAGASASQETKEGDSPKKRPRFPKKPKGGGGQAAQ